MSPGNDLHDRKLARPGNKAVERELAQTDWDVVVVGGGHNGLACAAYLARAGQKVLVLERRDVLGGACAPEEVWPGYRFSRCAYLCGLLHAAVIDEMRLVERGLSWTPASMGLFVPLPDGRAVQLWDSPERAEAEVQKFAPGDLRGWKAMAALIQRCRTALRPPDERDTWLGPSPTREQIEIRLGRDSEAIQLLFEWSMADLLDHFLEDEMLKLALLGQGVIGTNASPFDKGTASIHFFHSSGRMFGLEGTWGYVHGGIGRVSELLAEAASEAGARLQTGAPVARIIPEEGVELAEGTRIPARRVVSNADPVTTSRLLGEHCDLAWGAKVEAIPMTGCTLKLNLALKRLPSFEARPGAPLPHHQGQINTPLTREEWRAGFAASRQGELPVRLWTELYLQSAVDRDIAPEGKHHLSVFAQYVPYHLNGGWEARRDEAAHLAIGSISRFAPDLPDIIEQYVAAGPPDIESTIGLHGGHIFHGEMLPSNMWENRLSPRTPMPGIYLCGAGTHPGGSVIGVNGRNAAMAVLEDVGQA